jgi:prophage antirepressor-like protein
MVVVDDGTAWFVAKDVAKAIDAIWSGSVIRHIPRNRGGQIGSDPLGSAGHGRSE